MPRNDVEHGYPEPAEQVAAGHEPFHVALRAAIDARGLGLDRLRQHLVRRGINVSIASLSYWQSGRSRPEHPRSLRAVDELEQILQVPRGSLRSLLGPRRSRGPRSLRAEQPRPEAAIGAGAAMSELANVLPVVRERRLDVVTQQITAVIDETGRDVHDQTVILVRSRGPAVDRHVAMFRGDPGCDVDAVQVRAVRDCMIGRVVRHRHEPVLLAEILFGTTLHAGDVHLFGFEYVGGNTRWADYYGQAFRYPVEQCSIQVRFSPEMMPRRVFGFAQSQMDIGRREIGDLQLSSWGTALLSRAHVEPGAMGIGWEW